MLEIYCEMLNDLLDPSKLNLDVQVRQARQLTEETAKCMVENLPDMSCWTAAPSQMKAKLHGNCNVLMRCVLQASGGSDSM